MTSRPVNRLACSCLLTMLSIAGVRAQAPTAPAVSGELIVLLAEGDGAPKAEEVVATHKRGLALPRGLGAGLPGVKEVRLALVHRAQGAVKQEIEADPDSPRSRLERYLLITFAEGADLDAAEAALLRNPNVLHVERNHLLKLHIAPNDPLFPVNGAPLNYQWGSHTLNLPGAWDYAKGHSYIGLIDTGLEVNHPDLRAFNGSTFVGGNFRPHMSWDFFQPTTCQNPATQEGCVDELEGGGTFAGHGTHTAGIVGANANNGTGVAGACWNCSILMTSGTRLQSSQLSTADVANALTWLTDHGVQVISMSFGENLTCFPPSTNLGFVCTALDLAESRDVLMTASPGNDKLDIEFPASDPRVLSIGGIESTGAFWDRADEGPCPCTQFPGIFSACASVPTMECGSNYTVTPGSAQQDLVAPAKEVLSTFYQNRVWNFPLGCHDTEVNGVNHAGVGYDLCTGTSMSSPYVAAVAGILRSANPLLSKTQIASALTGNASRAGNWDSRLGFGVPNAGASVEAVLGRSNGAVVANRLTPLFVQYSSIAQDHLYTTFPQVGSAAYWSSAGYAPFKPTGGTWPDVPGYGYFPGAGCVVSPCLPEPGASVYIFGTDRSPNGSPLVPLYRMTFEGTFPGGPSNPNNRDVNYTTENAGVELFKSAGYKLDGIEGYIYQRCTPEPACIPAGAVRLYRMYNAARDDHAIFPESELAAMLADGYTQASGNQWIGYVYPNADGDFDNVIDGFEGLLGTNPAKADTDCDGLSDGSEILGYPNTDPRIANSGAGCVPPVARFTFSCAGLACSFNGSTSTDNVGIVSYAWTFGDSTSGSGVTTNRTYGATGAYTVTLTVTDTHGLQASTSRKVSVNGAAPAAAEGYFTVPLCRLVDTRSTTPLAAGERRVFQVSGFCGVPATAKAVAFNTKVFNPVGGGFLTAVPGNLSSSPFASSILNYDAANSPRGNNSILQLATNGAGTVGIATSTQVHLALDIVGYFSEDTTPAPGAQGPFGYQTVTPCRLLDTRSPSAPLLHGVPRNLTAQGLCGVPSGAPAAALNPVVVAPTAAGRITLWPSGTPMPTLFTIHFPAGIGAQANGVLAKLSATTPDLTAQYDATAGAAAHLVVDVYGYFRSTAPFKYRPITACRVLDTRFADRGAPAFASFETRTIQVQGNCGVPVGAKAAMLNIVAVSPAGGGHMIVYPSGTSAPLSSALNYSPAQGNLGNGLVAPLSTLANDLAIFTGAGTHLVIDVFGYFQ